MAGFAPPRIARIGRISHFREVERSELVDDGNIGRAGLDAGQILAHVELVKENLGVQGGAGVGVAGLGRVTQHAQIDAAPRSAMRRQLIVTGVAARRLDDVVGVGYRRAVGNEVKGRAGEVGAQIENRQIPGTVNADRMRGGPIDPGRRSGVERVLILPGSDLRGCAARIGSRLLRGGKHCPRRRARRVGRVLLLIVGEHRGDEAQADGARRGHARRIQRQALRIADGVNRRDRAVRRDLRRIDLDHEAGTDELDRLIIREKRLFVGRIRPPGSARQARRDQNDDCRHPPLGR